MWTAGRDAAVAVAGLAALVLLAAGTILTVSLLHDANHPAPRIPSSTADAT